MAAHGMPPALTDPCTSAQAMKAWLAQVQKHAPSDVWVCPRTLAYPANSRSDWQSVLPPGDEGCLAPFTELTKKNSGGRLLRVALVSTWAANWVGASKDAQNTGDWHVYLVGLVRNGGLPRAGSAFWIWDPDFEYLCAPQGVTRAAGGEEDEGGEGREGREGRDGRDSSDRGHEHDDPGEPGNDVGDDVLVGAKGDEQGTRPVGVLRRRHLGPNQRALIMDNSRRPPDLIKFGGPRLQAGQPVPPCIEVATAYLAGTVARLADEQAIRSWVADTFQPLRFKDHR